MRLLYDLGILLMNAGLRMAAPFNPKARLWVRGRKDIFRRMAEVVGPDDEVAWLHAASLGEFEQGRPVIEALREACPRYKILLTFFSPSGYEVRKNYAGADWVFYLPADTPRNARRFLRVFRPKVAVFVKYEFWINYLLAMRKEGTRLYLISSIFRRGQIFFRPYGGLFRRALGAFSHIFVQNDESRALLGRIGVRCVSVTGDTRFDRVCSIAARAKRLPEIERFAAGRPVFVAGSTWPPDEELLLGMIDHYRDVKFIVVPHEIDPDRIERLIGRIGRPALRYTQLTPETDSAEAGVLIVDTIGILSSLYRYGRWGYIGGGFGAGIHNTLEAAVYGIPVLFGPRFQKFKEARDLIKVGGGFSVASKDEFAAKMDELLTCAEVLAAAGESAGQFVKGNAGATDGILKELAL